MTRRLLGSLQGRLLALLLVAVLVVGSGSALFSWFEVRHELDELLDGHLAQAAALLVAQQAHSEENEQHPDAPTLHRYAPRVAFEVWHEGKLTLRSAGAPALATEASLSHFQSGFRTATVAGTAWRIFATHGPEHDVQVYVAEQMDARLSIVHAVLQSLFWPMAWGLPLLLLAGRWAVSRGLLPLKQLGNQLAQRDARTLHPVDLQAPPSELKPVLSALNGLFERITRLMASERRFTADAAHELRTPIAAIRAQAQVAQSTSDPELRRLALKSTVDGCDRAVRVTSQLLTLSRLESHAELGKAVVDLTPTVRQVLADLAPAALEKQQEVALIADEGLLVDADATLLSVLVRNLVDNAIRYSPPQAHVQVDLNRTASGRVIFIVQDGGPGMSASDRERLGERFFRGLGTEQDGSGLGWSIVRSIADLHGAEVRIQTSETLGGLRVTVEFPAPSLS